MFHRPVFSAGSHGSWLVGRESWVPLFDKYGVDAVFSGHEHDYERSKPINYTASMTSSQESYTKGTMYVVSGGWGAPLRESGSEWWTDFSFSEHHFVVIDISTDGTLNLQTKNLSNLTVDEIILNAPIMSESFSCMIFSLFVTIILILIVYNKRNAKKLGKNLTQNPNPKIGKRN